MGRVPQKELVKRGQVFAYAAYYRAHINVNELYERGETIITTGPNLPISSQNKNL